MFGRRNSTSIVTEPPPQRPTAPAVEEHDDDVGGLADLWSPGKTSVRKTVEQLLLGGQITESHLVQARQVSTQTQGKSLTHILLSMQAASEGQILSAARRDTEPAFRIAGQGQDRHACVRTAADGLHPEARSSADAV